MGLGDWWQSDESEQPDLLGLRLIETEQPSLADQYGVSLIDEGDREIIDSWSHLADKYDADLPSDGGNGESTGVDWGKYLSCDVGSALGIGPTISLGKGPAEFGLQIPVGVGSFELSRPGGHLAAGIQIGPSDPLGLAELTVGGKFDVGGMGESSLNAQVRILNVSCKISVETDMIADKLDEVLQDAAEKMAPHAERILRDLGLPSAP